MVGRVVERYVIVFFAVERRINYTRRYMYGIAVRVHVVDVGHARRGGFLDQWEG